MSLYTQLAEIPCPTGAHFVSRTGESTTIQVAYSARNHVKNVRRTMSKTILGMDIPGTYLGAGPMVDTDVIAQVLSPSLMGTRRAVWRKSGNDKYVEVWKGNSLEYQWVVTDKHGEFYADDYLSSFYFSPSEESVVYVAEAYAPETKDPFAKFRFTPDFGEGLVGKRRPTIYILRFAEDSVPIPVCPSQGEVRFGQPVFSPVTDNILYATGYEYTVDGRMLGIKGCFNRPSGIWELRLDITKVTEANPSAHIPAACKKLTPAHLSCRSPRTLGNEKWQTLFWLACASGGTHLATSTIYKLNITHGMQLHSEAPKELLPIVHVPITTVTPAFPGLYPDYNFAAMPFMWRGIVENPSLVVASTWGARRTILRIDVLTGGVTDLTPIKVGQEGDAFSWTLLATDGRAHIVCARSSPAVPYEVMLGTCYGSVVWHSFDKPTLSTQLSDALKSIKTSVVPIPGRGLVETILIQGPTGQTTPPCITSPHGGPHGSSTTAFVALNTALVLDGYTLSLPNYTGSTGYGEKFLQDLVGKCGDLDIEDTMASARHLIALGISKEGYGKQLISGGSHGGFVTAHLIGRYPAFFSAAVLRNPVISAGATSNTDIPDWYFSEFGEAYPIHSMRPAYERNKTELHQIPPLISSAMFARLQAVSPIASVDAIRTRVLLLIGAADRRVSPTQGIEFYHALKARNSAGKGSTVEMLVFEGESHPIDGVEASRACAEAVTQWFARVSSPDSNRSFTNNRPNFPSATSTNSWILNSQW